MTLLLAAKLVGKWSADLLLLSTLARGSMIVLVKFEVISSRVLGPVHLGLVGRVDRSFDRRVLLALLLGEFTLLELALLKLTLLERVNVGTDLPSGSVDASDVSVVERRGLIVVRLFLHVLRREGLHQEHLLSLSLFITPGGKLFLGLVLATGTLLSSHGCLLSLSIHLQECKFAKARSSTDLVLGELGALAVHVALARLLLLQELHALVLGLLLLGLDLFLLFLEANEPKLSDFLLNALLALHLLLLVGRQRLWGAAGQRSLRGLLVGISTGAISLSHSRSGSLPLSDRLEHDLPVLLDLVPQDEVGGRASVTLAFAKEAALFGWEGIELLVGAGRSSALAKGVSLCVVHQVLLGLQAHALVSKAVGERDCGLDRARILHAVDADGLVLLTFFIHAVHALQGVDVVGVVLLVEHRIALQLAHVLAFDHFE